MQFRVMKPQRAKACPADRGREQEKSPEDVSFYSGSDAKNRGQMRASRERDAPLYTSYAVTKALVESRFLAADAARSPASG